jgi:hypothetical protein
MDLGWMVLGLVGWTLGMLFVLVLMRIAGDEDRAARRLEKRLFPYSDVTITRWEPEEKVELDLEPRLRSH